MLAGLTVFIALVGLWSTISAVFDIRLVILFGISALFVASLYKKDLLITARQ